MPIKSIDTDHPTRVRIVTDKHVVSVPRALWDKKVEELVERQPTWSPEGVNNRLATMFVSGALKSQ